MKALLDTHMMIWLSRGTVSERVRAIYEDTANEICLSTASVWEIAIKRSLRKLHFPYDLDLLLSRFEKQGGYLLPIAPRHAARVEQLPWLHRDPFDRLIAATCLSDGYTLLSADTAFDGYGVERLD